MRTVRECVDAAARANTAEVARFLYLVNAQRRTESAEKLKRDFQNGTTSRLA